mmetsp:Transcript_56600/g.106654  ORF Transcript_56600/g.106654 Transcript_56600/m.106654 type:complete len:526 (+) Transcript_56600:112-1689(+)
MGHAGSRQGLEDVRRRIESRIGRLSVTGRYHRLPRKLEDDYTVDSKVLGSGYSGVVLLAEDKSTHSKCAVKRFKLSSLSASDRQEIATECEILLSMDHPHIVRLVDVYETGTHLSLVMECMDGGELFERIKTKKRFPENEAAQATSQMLLAINYIHRRGIVHRDVKLENFMYESKTSDHLKMIDFGFGKICKPDTHMTDSLGTVAYCAPEVLTKKYTSQCDLWSLGVIVFILLSGYMPFAGSDEAMVAAITNRRYKMKKDRWAGVSQQAWTFTLSLLEVDPDKRLTAEQALKHEWIQKHSNVQTKPEHINASIVDGLTNFARLSAFRRACMSVLAWGVTGNEDAKVREAFLQMDANQSGTISMTEFKKALQDMHVADDAINKAFKALDINRSHEIDYAEFLAAMVVVPSCIDLSHQTLHKTFRRFDTDSSGYITEANLQEVLGDKFDGQNVSKLICEADTSNDGAISFSEFMQYMGDVNTKWKVGQFSKDALWSPSCSGSDSPTDESLVSELSSPPTAPACCCVQ